jgi:hypothetical protein
MILPVQGDRALNHSCAACLCVLFSSCAGGFGQQRDPQAQEDQTTPADMAQKARDISSPGVQEDATVSGPKGGV